MKGEDGSELFEECVVLARQYLGVGLWQVWDMRPKPGRNCPLCSSRAERIVRHDRATRCPGAARPAQDRVEAARQAIAARAARIRESENDQAIEAALSRAAEIDREERGDEGEEEGDDEEVAVALDEPGKDEAGDEEADAPMVSYLFLYVFPAHFLYSCPTVRSTRSSCEGAPASDQWPSGGGGG